MKHLILLVAVLAMCVTGAAWGDLYVLTPGGACEVGDVPNWIETDADSVNETDSAGGDSTASLELVLDGWGEVFIDNYDDPIDVSCCFSYYNFYVKVVSGGPFTNGWIGYSTDDWDSGAEIPGEVEETLDFGSGDWTYISLDLSTYEPWGTPDPTTLDSIGFEILGTGTILIDHITVSSTSEEGMLDGGAAEPEACVQVSPSPPVVGEEVTVWLFVDGETAPIGPSGEPMCIWDDSEVCLEEGINSDWSLTFTWTQDMQDLVADPYATVGIWADLCPPDDPWDCDPGALAEMPISVFVAGGGDACADLEPVPFVPPPPPVTEGAPVAGMLGLGLVAAACALGGAMTLRKK